MRISSGHAITIASTSRRTGLTLVEVMVALVLVAVGLLGIAGSSALLLRATDAQNASARATRRAASRIAQLSAAGCAKASAGSADDPHTGTIERWTVRGPVNGALLIDDSLAWVGQGVRRNLMIRSALLC